MRITDGKNVDNTWVSIPAASPSKLMELHDAVWCTDDVYEPDRWVIITRTECLGGDEDPALRGGAGAPLLHHGLALMV